MKKILSIVLTMCLLMSTMCLATVSAADVWTVTHSGGGLNSGVTEGDVQAPTVTQDASGNISISVPARDASNARIYLNAKRAIVKAYAYDVEFTMNIKKQEHANSLVTLKLQTYIKTNTLLFRLGAATPTIQLNDATVTGHSVTLGTSHTYRLKGSSDEGYFFIDGVLMATTKALDTQDNSENNSFMIKDLDNGGTSDAAAQELEITNFVSRNSTDRDARDAADAAMVAEINAAEGWEDVKTLITETYAGKLYITDADLAEAETLAQEELYGRLVGQTYTYPGDVAVKFRAAIEAQKNVADADIIAEFNDAADWQAVKTLVSTYQAKLELTAAEIAEAAQLTQSELYDGMVDQEYTSFEDVATAFRAAVTAQKVADAWLLSDKIALTGEGVAKENGALAFALPARDGSAKKATATITNSSGYSFDISFKAQLDENVDAIEMEIVQAPYLFRIQIARDCINYQTDDWYEYPCDLGTEEHSFRLVGNISTNSQIVNPEKIYFFIDNKFVGLIGYRSKQGNSGQTMTFTVTDKTNGAVSARVWDYKFSKSGTTFNFEDGNDVTLVTFTTIAEDTNTKAIWVAYDENNKMTSYAFSDAIIKPAATGEAINLSAPSNFVEDYKVKVMVWSGVGAACTPFVDAIERYTQN